MTAAGLPSIAELLTALAALGGGATGASATIGLTVDPCVGAGDRALVATVMRVELGAGIDVREAADVGHLGAAAAIVHVSCDGEGTVRAVADDNVTGKTVARRFALPDGSPAVRARLLGLAVSEFLTAAWAEMALPERAAGASTRTPGVSAPPAARAAALSVVTDAARSQDARRWLSMFYVQRQAWSGLASTGAGVELAVAVSRPRSLAVIADVDLARGRDANGAGTIEASSLSGSLRLAAQRRFESVVLEAGAGGRLGGIRVEGRPDPILAASGRTFTAMWGGVIAAASARAVVTRWLSVRVAIEAGVALSAVEARVGDTIWPVVRGGWAGITVGGGVGW